MALKTFGRLLYIQQINTTSVIMFDLKEEVERQKSANKTLPPAPPAGGAYLQQHLAKANDEAELKRATDRVANLQTSLRHAHREIECLKSKVDAGAEIEASLQAKVESLKKEAESVRAAHEADLKNKILQLEEEVGKQRQRCMTIIEEKEDEVAMLKSTMETTIEMAFRASSSNSKKSPSPPAHLAAAALMTATGRGRSDSVADDLTASSSHQTEGMVLYYEEELNLKTQELAR